MDRAIRWLVHGLAALASVCWLAAAGAAEPVATTGADNGQEIAWHMSSLPAGDQPFEILAIDLDGDGDLDLAVTNSKDSTVGVFLGNGDGTFAAQITFPTDTFPRGLVAADFNRDGIVDLAAAATHGGGVALHLGQGGGRFAPMQRIATGKRPFHAVTADINGDGNPDIVLANETLNVSVLLGDGSGNFTPHRYDTGKWPSNVVVADFDEDGHLDFASTNWGYNNVTILFGTGDGIEFSEPRAFTYDGHGLFAIIAADLDRDGHADMVWNDMKFSGMYVLYGDGHGEFPRTRLVPAGDGVRSIRATDLNGDGWPDLVSADTGAGDVSVALADGHGGFQPTQHVPVGVKPRVLTTGDFNGDGRPDVAVTNMDSDSVTVLLQQGMVPRPTKAFDPGPQESRRVLEFAGLETPNALVLTPSGDLIVSDQAHNRIVRVAQKGGAISPFAGTGQPSFRGDDGDAGEASFRYPAGLALDSAGNLYVADFDNNRIRRIDPAGRITTVAGTGESGFSGDDGPATAAKLWRPYSLALDSAGALYVADLQNVRIRRIDPSGVIITVAGGARAFGGDGGPATEAGIGLLTTVAVDRQGNLFIADQLNRAVRKVDGKGIITTVAGGKQPQTDGDIGQPTTITSGADGAVYFASGGGITRLTSDGKAESASGPERAGAGYQGSPTGLAVDAGGAIYISDPKSNSIVRFDCTGGTAQVVTGGDGAAAPPR